MRKTCLLTLLFASASLLRAMTVIYPVEAIEDLWLLPADDFKQKHGGINVSGIGPGDEGWYVRYRHDNLTYLFGPVETSEEARKRKWEMEAVRDAAIRNRASLHSSQVDYVKFTYSGVYGRGGGDVPFDGSGPRISEDGKSGPEGDLDGDGIANAKDDDMDGDGIGNGQDGDMDGDGVPNGGDDYRFGTNPALTDGLLADGSGKDGQGQGKDGKSGDANQAGNRDGSQAGNAGNQSGRMAGQQGDSQSGSQGNMGMEQGSPGQRGQRQLAGIQNQRGMQSGSPGSQSGQMGQQSQSGQQGQQGQSGQQSSSQSSQSGQSGGPPMAGGGGGGNPIMALLRMILGI